MAEMIILSQLTAPVKHMGVGLPSPLFVLRPESTTVARHGLWWQFLCVTVSEVPGVSARKPSKILQCNND